MAGGKPRIAVIDTDGAAANCLAKSLDAKGYAALPWSWGNGMLAMLARERPDLAIIDVDGRTHPVLWLMLRRLPKEPGVRDIRIMLCAASAAWVPCSARCDQILIRPARQHDLFYAIEAAIGPPPKPLRWTGR